MTIRAFFARFKTGCPNAYDPEGTEGGWTEWAILRSNGTVLFDGNHYDNPQHREAALQQANDLYPAGRCRVANRTATAEPWQRVHHPDWMQDCRPEDPSDEGIGWMVWSPSGTSVAVNEYAAHHIAAAMQAAGAGRTKVLRRILIHSPWTLAGNEGRSTVGAAGYGRPVRRI